jgi:hypothetical protein
MELIFKMFPSSTPCVTQMAYGIDNLSLDTPCEAPTVMALNAALEANGQLFPQCGHLFTHYMHRYYD